MGARPESERRTRSLNNSISGIDGSDTISILEKGMKTFVFHIPNLINLITKIYTVSTIYVIILLETVTKDDIVVTESKDISSLSTYKLGEVVHALLCVVLQVLAIITTVGLVQNMSPKRTS
ncbi:hypothetical protein KSP40_PGU003661 [Platanthera guangdongensis]|uniref:Uncharacterized protein n=1 Tax=Platanthera guangdongensis TaxID=2320717 RepID=A0ABR2MIZ7_9ASPA